MTRNVKRFLAGLLLTLAPSSTLARQVEFAAPALPSEGDEYVSVKEGVFQVPTRQGGPVATIGPAAESNYVLNQTGAYVYLGLGLITGGFGGMLLPYPVAQANHGGFLINSAAPFPGSPAIHQYFWTVDPFNPANAKTCFWQIEVSDVGGSCSAQVRFAAYGGATCTIDGALSFIYPSTCEAWIVTGIL